MTVGDVVTVFTIVAVVAWNFLLLQVIRGLQMVAEIQEKQIQHLYKLVRRDD